MRYLTEHEGVTSFKLFMAYPGVFYCDDGQILRAMQTAGDVGATIMMHAENGIAIDVLVQQALARGETDPKYHASPGPPLLEGEATHRAIVLAEVAGNVPALHRPHVGVARRSSTVAEARNAGRNVFAETCPQYLYMTRRGARWRKPGLRGRQVGVLAAHPRAHDDHQHHADLWKGLRTNDLAVVSTDHCPFCFKDQKELGVGDFSKIPNGIGGVEHRMELLYQGVVTGELTLERWVETCCTTPARMFGMYPQEGRHRPRRPTPTSSCGTRARRPTSASTASTT